MPRVSESVRPCGSVSKNQATQLFRRFYEHALADESQDGALRTNASPTCSEGRDVANCDDVLATLHHGRNG